MRKLLLFMAACLITGCFLLIAQPVSAAIAVSPAWEPVESNVFTITNKKYDGWLEGDVFGVYDYGTDSKLPVFSFATLPKATSTKALIFTMTDDMYTLYLGNTSGPSLKLGDSNRFGFYLENGSTSYSYTYSPVEDSLYAFDLYFGDRVYVSVANASPVPIPTAFLLLGSGLVGLVGFRRKNKA